jgi:hypothetical protein
LDFRKTVEFQGCVFLLGHKKREADDLIICLFSTLNFVIAFFQEGLFIMAAFPL